MADEMGAKNSTKSKGFEGTLVHGTMKYKIELPSLECTIADLSDVIYEVTKVPSSRQRLIYKGKSLTKTEESLSESNIKNGAKIMLIGKKNDPVEERLICSISKVENDFKIAEEKFRETEKFFLSLKQGYLNENMTHQSLDDIEKSLKRQDEGFMKCIEKLDSMEIDITHQEAKAKRRTLIKIVQKLHDEVDIFEGKLKEYRVDHSI
ncbi:BAG family molecular chaperone regulator 1-like [Rhopilema esculentum]|uniref:BAG family molecular chaperone regulator 1-like n=1 Tax=Rhopilema esculentum TaxID=499914 RepID=UPI0031DF198D